MGPTVDGLNNMASLAGVAQWAGTDGDVHTQLMTALGTRTKLRDLVYIARDVWDQVVGAFKIDTTTGGADCVQWRKHASRYFGVWSFCG